MLFKKKVPKVKLRQKLRVLKPGELPPVAKPKVVKVKKIKGLKEKLKTHPKHTESPPSASTTSIASETPSSVIQRPEGQTWEQWMKEHPNLPNQSLIETARQTLQETKNSPPPSTNSMPELSGQAYKTTPPLLEKEPDKKPDKSIDLKDHKKEAVPMDTPEWIGEILHMGAVYMVGIDHQLYEKVGGVIKCWVPIPKVEAYAHLEELNEEKVPPIGMLADMYERFLSQYKREVGFVVGKKRDGSGWTFFIPQQEGSSCHMNMDDDEGMSTFLEDNQYIGSVHIHPGNCCNPSSTDKTDWQSGAKTGIHWIFGRDGSYTVNLQCRGYLWDPEEHDLKGVERIKVKYTKSGNKSLHELLKIEAPTITQVTSYGNSRYKNYRDSKDYRNHWSSRYSPSSRNLSEYSREEWEEYMAENYGPEYGTVPSMDSPRIPASLVWDGSQGAWVEEGKSLTHQATAQSQYLALADETITLSGFEYPAVVAYEMCGSIYVTSMATARDFMAEFTPVGAVPQGHLLNIPASFDTSGDLLLQPGEPIIREGICHS